MITVGVFPDILRLLFCCRAILPLQSKEIEGGDLHISFKLINIILTIWPSREEEERRKARRMLILCNIELIIFMFPKYANRDLTALCHIMRGKAKTF